MLSSMTTWMLSSVSSWISALIAIYLIGKLFLVITRKTEYAKIIEKIPGPPAVPLLGNAWDLWVPHEDIFMGIIKLVNTIPNASMIRIWLGLDGYIFLKKAKPIEEILSSNKHITKSDDYTFLHQWLGLGLLTSTGERWQKNRKLLSPSFHFAILDDFIVVFNEQSQLFVSLLKKKAATGEKFNVYPYVTRCALDIICESTMGQNVNAQQVTDSEYVKAIYGMGSILLLRIVRPWLQPPFLFNLSSHRKDEKAYLKTLHTFSRKVIKERRELLQKNGIKKEEKEPEVFGKKRRLAFLDLLLETTVNGKPLDPEDIRMEVDTFMFEGHDTTSAGLSWAIFLLGRHPEIQKKVQEELDDVLGQNSNRPITPADLAKLKYMDAVIKETLRLYPSVPVFGRKLKETAVIDGFTFPAETTVFIGAFFAHRDPDVFPDPESFNPDRFLSDAMVGRNPFAYVPFSAGPRNCIGQKFAMMEEKVVLADVFRNFNVVSYDDPKDIKLLVEPILRPANGITITLTERF